MQDENILKHSENGIKNILDLYQNEPRAKIRYVNKPKQGVLIMIIITICLSIIAVCLMILVFFQYYLVKNQKHFIEWYVETYRQGDTK